MRTLDFSFVKNDEDDMPSSILLKPRLFVGKLFFFLKLFSWKVNSLKVNYFPMFGSVMENELENTFQYLIMLWKMN